MNPKLKQMPLWRDANRLLLLIEDAVRGFSRYHKYTLGSDLRKQAMNIVRLIARAVHDREGGAQHIKRLVFSIDDMKVLIQLAQLGRCFACAAPDLGRLPECIQKTMQEYKLVAGFYTICFGQRNTSSVKLDKRCFAPEATLKKVANATQTSGSGALFVAEEGYLRGGKAAGIAIALATLIELRMGNWR